MSLVATSGALAHGLQQLVPQGADQFMNAVACERAGAGPSMALGEVTADVLAATADQLLIEPAFATTAAGRDRLHAPR